MCSEGSAVAVPSDSGAWQARQVYLWKNAVLTTGYVSVPRRYPNGYESPYSECIRLHTNATGSELEEMITELSDKLGVNFTKRTCRKKE